MAADHVNYEPIAPTYNRRYAVRKLQGVADVLLTLAQNLGAKRILEVGCGTGRWLTELHQVSRQVFGLDLSFGMLEQARLQKEPLDLVCGQAVRPPFLGNTFDLVFCVNALHHFDHPRIFISEARRLLKPGGALAIVGMDPRRGQDKWYIYQYFDGTYETDLSRFPSGGTILDWMAEHGFDRVEWRPAERIVALLTGRNVLDDCFLQKNGTSQLALLTDEAYATGMRRIESALGEAEATGKALVFPVDISLTIIVGWVREGEDIATEENR